MLIGSREAGGLGEGTARKPGVTTPPKINDIRKAQEKQLEMRELGNSQKTIPIPERGEERRKEKYQ